MQIILWRLILWSWSLGIFQGAGPSHRITETTGSLPVTGKLDCLLLQVDSWATLMDIVEITIHSLQDFGWLLNLKTSALNPTRRLKCLSPDSKQATAFLLTDEL